MKRFREKESLMLLDIKKKRTLSKNLELSYCGRILQITNKKPTWTMQRAKVQVIEDLEGKIEIHFQGKKLKYTDYFSLIGRRV